MKQIKDKTLQADQAAKKETIEPPKIVQSTRAVRHQLTTRIFKVQSEATGDGIYNCYKQVLRGTEWDDTDGDAKFDDDVGAGSDEVLNLEEAYPEAIYYPALAAGDLLMASQTLDDESNYRWIGLPIIKRPVNETFGITRSAKISVVDPATLTAKLLDADGSVVGNDITVYPREHLGTNSLSSGSVWPGFFANDFILVVRERDNKWYFYGTVDDTTVCTA